MRTRFSRVVLPALLAVFAAGLGAQQAVVDWPTVAKIREEGLQRSRVMDLESCMTDVLGARLTLPEDMKRAQAWALAEMGRIGPVKPGFQFLQDRIPGTGGHTNLDFFDTIQAEDLMKNAVVMASYAYHAAMHDTRVPRKTGK